MAALFTAASTQYLTNAAPAMLTYPFTVGMWANLAAVGASPRTLFSLSDTATTNNYLLVRITSTERFDVTAAAGGTENSATSVIEAAAVWHFVIGRFITSTNRKLAVISYNNNISHASVTTARNPTGLDTLTVGAHQTSGGVSEPWDGLIGELWYTNTDIQADGAQLLDSTLFQLAYGGPFSIPHIAKDILEYRSFRKTPASNTDEIGEVFHGAAGRQIWANTNGVTTGYHPPLPYWYIKPGQIKNQLVV